jgi:perosamine synthetase
MDELIPVANSDVSGNEEKYVVDAIRSSWISSSGAYVTRAERELAELSGARAAIMVANGTVALHLALLALGVERGDEVIVPSLSYIAAANSVRYVGAEPVFVDVEPSTWCIDASKIAAAVTPRTRGIIPVHVYGHPADMDAVTAVAKAHGLWVLEDAAEAHLARYKGKPTGSIGTMATFSFYGNKVLTSGEGGAVTTDDPQLEAQARLLRNQGMDPQRRYFHPVVGHNFRMTNVACAILCAQLERRDAIMSRRRAIFARYRSSLEGIPGIGFQPVAPWAELSPWLFCITIDPEAFGMDRDALITELAKQRIDTRPFFIPMHRMPPYEQASRARGEALPVSDALSASGLNLPTFNGLEDAQIDRIAAAVRSACRFAAR